MNSRHDKCDGHYSDLANQRHLQARTAFNTKAYRDAVQPDAEIHMPLQRASDQSPERFEREVFGLCAIADETDEHVITR